MYLFLISAGIFLNILIFTSLFWSHPAKHLPRPNIATGDGEIETHKTLEISWDVGIRNQIWPKLPSCENYFTRFAKRGTLPGLALASYPGLGNTWVRFLIEAATGVFTGSLYGGKYFVSAGHLGETRPFDDGSTIVQKTHLRCGERKACPMTWRENHIQRFGGRAVVIIRNPYKAIVSRWNHAEAGFKKTASKASLNSPAFEQFVFHNIAQWFEVVEDAVLFMEDVHIIFYENLVEDPVQETRKLLKYFKLPADEGRLSCLSNATTGYFLRPDHQDKVPFTFTHHQLVRAMIDRADRIVTGRYGSGLPLDKYSEYQQVLC
eukprot:GFUD01033089.1.p1 GENE.GFUD01033089.1~~GFUD01033089.1.p1  ORF type:complete len:320 (-),score=75.32 GFUD01033089.1:155-1114(-)